MKSFTKGFAAGATALAVGVPLMAQMAFAASGDQATSESALVAANRPVPTQACVQAMANLETAHLASFDEQSAERKAKMLVHRDALVAAAGITDDTQRKDALKTAHESMRPDGEQKERPEAITTAMEAVKTACGDTLMFKGGMRSGGPEGRGGMFMKRMHRGMEQGAQESAPAAL